MQQLISYILHVILPKSEQCMTAMHDLVSWMGGHQDPHSTRNVMISLEKLRLTLKQFQILFMLPGVASIIFTLLAVCTILGEINDDNNNKNCDYHIDMVFHNLIFD
jgi:hypothetical protein